MSSMWGIAFGALVLSMLKDIIKIVMALFALIFELIAIICDNLIEK
jgi:hypothetical protein